VETDNERDVTNGNVLGSVAVHLAQNMTAIYSPGDHANGQTSFQAGVSDVLWSRDGGVTIKLVNGQTFVLAIARTA